MIFNELGLLASFPFRSTQPLLVDVGAHQGGVSKKFAAKGWRVIAFEPEPKNRAAFERHLAGFDDVVCLPNAVSDVTGEREPFYVSREHYGIHSLKPFHETHQLAFEVETVCLNDVLTDMNVSSVTLLKVDIEGADFLALKGFDFARYQPELVMIEFMDERTSKHFGYTHHDVVAYMDERGYTTFVSEWAPIKEYGREGKSSPPHTWLQCVPYPLGHEPAWGNLILVPQANTTLFEQTLAEYLRHLKQAKQRRRLSSFLLMLPGVSKVAVARSRILSCIKQLL